MFLFKKVLYFLVIFLGFLINCLPVDDKISKEDAQSQIYFAADFIVIYRVRNFVAFE